MTHNGRHPRWVYARGDEPDYRFSFANERTYLAWVRTALALMAAGVAIDVVDTSFSSAAQELLGALLVTLGLLCAITAWTRWALAERAIRRSRPLPSFGFSSIFTCAVVIVGMILLAAH